MKDIVKILPLGTVSPYCKGNSNCPGFLIKYKNNRILLDCGNGITRLMNFSKDFDNLTIIISHLHSDHFGDVSSIAYASEVYHKLGLLNHKIKLYMPDDKDSINYKYITNLCSDSMLEVIPYNDYTIIEISDIKIDFIKTIHPINTYATNIICGNKKISYSADTDYFRDITNFFKNANLLICEATYLKNEKGNATNHLSTVDAATIAKESNVDKLLLTHLWPEHSKEEYLNEAKAIFNNCEIAVEGNIYNI